MEMKEISAIINHQINSRVYSLALHSKRIRIQGRTPFYKVLILYEGYATKTKPHLIITVDNKDNSHHHY